ncbi:hypothetical protein A2U01_0075266, partial [Trifolium medium]|nr:hypothetical protein [Trifolium medium]
APGTVISISMASIALRQLLSAVTDHEEDIK